METWILFTLLAVVMQSVRTAAQKQIAQSLYASTTTLIRYLFGLPFALAYFCFLRSVYQEEALVGNAVFYRAASLAAIAQIIATVFLIKALTLRNFAVGTNRSPAHGCHWSAVFLSGAKSSGLSVGCYRCCRCAHCQ